ncbi:DHA2 family efflux MFS transporter permease subunit [Mesorhizobium sp. BH1-1-5]|uniref:DHA2 family efflux MFS transporter permease subunit n=1 Tax=Mesorhizobium sp. BH1-1-5 TaxID=2876661 RepID=UPI001CC96DE9|nr:DHA2 family efflux MFS transporter permease subunit [Mesorhizobium sp. BH1-1-5]MBZ9987207.1 DHA2 family efflux MFS transporter permease subunit [Mesorhizobium sp. BH1-1-5]
MSDAATAHGDQSRSAAGRRNPWLIAIVVSIATFMLVLDTSIANVALRNIAGSLAAGMDESTWVITTYLVANSVIIPVSGWLTSVIGRKRYYMICVATFTLASLLCGLAPNLPTLIAFRILQGLGGGGMAPSEQSILADTFPPEKRSQAFALYGIAVIVAPTVGPTIGGWLTDNFSWHWIFFINVPFGIMSLALVQWLVIEPEILERERRERLSKGLKVDWIGFILVAMALGCLEVFLDEGQRNDWFASAFITAFAVISAVSFLLLVPWEWTRREPIVDIRLLFSRQFGMSFLVMMAVGAVLFSSTQLLPQLQQTTFDYTATLSGLSMMPGGIAMLMLMPVSGFAAGVVQPRYLIMMGMSVVAVALWHMTSLTPDASFGFFAYARIYMMIGLPFLFIPISTAAYVGLPPQKTDQASSLINVARNIGGSIGVSLSNTVIAQNAQLHQSVLVGHTAQSSEAYQQTLRQVTDHFVAEGSPLTEARQQAVGWIGQEIGRQASLLAYVDVFFYCAIATALLVPFALLLRPPRPGPAKQQDSPAV